jgi:hypothetical protein
MPVNVIWHGIRVLEVKGGIDGKKSEARQQRSKKAKKREAEAYLGCIFTQDWRKEEVIQW